MRLALAFALLLSAPAFAQTPHVHGSTVPDWYDPGCCNNSDCRPVKDEDVEYGEDKNGDPIVRFYRNGRSDENRVITYTKNQFRTSQDERLHACWVADTGWCFYIRGGY